MNEREREAREALDRTMDEYASNEHPSREYPHNQRKYENDVAANREMLDAYAAAVRAETLAILESEECAHDLAHTVDDVNPRKTHTQDQADAAIYCKRIAKYVRATLTPTEGTTDAG